jgi:hypothetical protein
LTLPRHANHIRKRPRPRTSSGIVTPVNGRASNSANEASRKSALYVDLLPKLNSRTIRLVDNVRLVNQLASLERRTARGGKDSIDHPPSGKDDVSNAVAGVAAHVMHRHASSSQPSRILAAPALREDCEGASGFFRWTFDRDAGMFLFRSIAVLSQVRDPDHARASCPIMPSDSGARADEVHARISGPNPYIHLCSH